MVAKDDERLRANTWTAIEQGHALTKDLTTAWAGLLRGDDAMGRMDKIKGRMGDE